MALSKRILTSMFFWSSTHGLQLKMEGATEDLEIASEDLQIKVCTVDGEVDLTVHPLDQCNRGQYQFIARR